MDIYNSYFLGAALVILAWLLIVTIIAAIAYARANKVDSMVDTYFTDSMPINDTVSQMSWKQPENTIITKIFATFPGGLGTSGTVKTKVGTSSGGAQISALSADLSNSGDIDGTSGYSFAMTIDDTKILSVDARTLYFSVVIATGAVTTKGKVTWVVQYVYLA